MLSQVDASLSCTAEGLPWLWVLHGAIEKIMLGQARDNITALIDFFQREVSAGALNKQPQQQQQQEPSSPPVITFHYAILACMHAHQSLHGHNVAG